jgi:hypothetical protein
LERNIFKGRGIMGSGISRKNCSGENRYSITSNEQALERYEPSAKPRKKKSKVLEVATLYVSDGRIKGTVILPKSWIGKKVLITLVEEVE